MTCLIRFGLLLASVLLAACVQASPAKTGTGGDAGAEESDASTLEAAVPDGDVNESDAGAPDAGAVDGGAAVVLAPGESIVVSPPQLTCGDDDCGQCQQAVLTLDVEGSAPSGVFHAQRATLHYVSGLGFVTRVRVFGTLAGREVALDISIDRGAGESVPWSYATISTDDYQLARRQDAAVRLDDGAQIRHADGSYSDILRYLAATVEVEEHEFVSVEMTYPPTRLRGAVVIDEPGWSLRIPFEFDHACDYQGLAI